MPLRKTIFWLHLITGLAAGLVILVMSVTGVLLTYEKQMVAWADRGFRSPPPTAGATPLPIDALIANVEQGGDGGAAPSSVTLRADPEAPATVSLGRGRAVYVNPYTGQVLGEGSQRVRAFFRGVTDWHRWLALTDASRATGKAVTGACNLAFLFLVVSGFYLWWPKNWRWRSVKAVTLFGRGLRGKARDWNWHNVIGFWCAVPLAIVVASGAVISYPWASDLLYRVAGETPPARGGGGGGPGGGRAIASAGPSPRGERPDRPERREGPGRPDGREAGRRGPSTQRAATTTATTAVSTSTGIDAAFARAREHSDGWRTITLQLPRSPDAPLAFTIEHGDPGQPQKKGQLTVDRGGNVVKWEPFSAQTLGRRLRSLARFSHTGEVLGVVGQTIAGLASAGAAVLVYTGFALSYRRFFRRRAKSQPRATPELVASAS